MKYIGHLGLLAFPLTESWRRPS